MTPHNELALVIGIDASGKSTFMHGLESNLGYTVLEPTASAEAKAFKSEHLGKPLTDELVLERQSLFTRLNTQFDAHITAQQEHSNVATSGSRLVTNISHAVMRSIIGDRPVPVAAIVSDWNESQTVRPDSVVFMHAPMDTIKARILERQERGVSGEQLLGFNSLHFLTRYQDALMQTYDALDSDLTTLEFDSSRTSIDTAIQTFINT